MKIPDVQAMNINGKKINKVGIRQTYGEVIFKNKTIPADFSVYVSLVKGKGIHMSRLPEILLEQSPVRIDEESLKKVLNELEKRSGDFCKDYYIKIGFNYAREIFSPVTKLKNIMLIPIKIKAKKTKDEYNIEIDVTTPYTSLCPCSKEISEHSAHNQKSDSLITFKLHNIDIETIINKVILITEDSSSCPIYNILKREDEKYVTEKAYKNPKFVEDVCRDISQELDKLLDKEISDYCIVINHEESIHQHNAVAVINAGRILR